MKNKGARPSCQTAPYTLVTIKNIFELWELRNEDRPGDGCGCIHKYCLCFTIVWIMYLFHQLELFMLLREDGKSLDLSVYSLCILIITPALEYS